jgi:pimeloyl-ACP methyl ester carboxylesterase
MTTDILAVMDAEQVETARIVGYSMGATIALRMLIEHPGRIAAAVIGGMGAHVPHRLRDGNPCDDCDSTAGTGIPARRVSWRFLRAYFRHFDPVALYEVYRGVFRAEGDLSDERFGTISAPVLCVAGTRDHLCQPCRRLAAAIPGAQFVRLDGQTHLGTLGDPRFREAILGFFESISLGATR